MIISNLPIDLGRVKQNYSTDNENRPLLMSGVAGVSSTSDRGSNESVVNNSIYANPSTGTIHANISGNVTGSSGSCTGNAATATQFSANKAVTLTGDVTGTASSKAGWSVATTLANSGVTAGTYGPSADVTGNNNATISVPEITVDAKGRVTSVTNRTLTCKNNTYTVNNATLTIQKNGTTVKTFTANASSNVTANITVPTKVSELDNDSNYLTSVPNLDASKITSGTIDIARLPAGALERLVVVANETARFALTTSSVQLGDVVKQTDTGMMYMVVDESKLNSSAGYEEFTAGSATSVPWSGVTGKPSSYTPSSHTHGNITNAGAIGSTANKPLITTTNGVITTGSFGTTANTFCQGNDSRLSDARTPTAHTHSASDITSGLATVATSGSYNDLSNKPTIPTVNNATLTIQKNGTTVKTFTANASSNVTANITVPTKTSELTNDSHVSITTSTDTTSTASPAHSGTFTCIDSVTRDSNGHVTKVNTKTVTLPSDRNTDTLVTQNVSTANENHPILLSATKDATTNQGAKTSIFASGVKVNPSTGTVTATAFSGNLTGNVTGNVTGSSGSCTGNSATATNATNNANGKELTNTIIKGLSISGKTITYTQIDGNTGTLTTQDTNTWTAFKGATSSANGTAGYVPAPTKGNQDKFFKADGTWATPTNTTYSAATQSAEGLMSPADKTKLDGLSNYTLPTASSELGGVKTTSTVTSTSGLTACPIISGVPYYKDTNTTYSAMSAAEATTGTATSARSITAKVLNDKINEKIATKANSSEVYHYGVCSTAAATAAKVVSITDFVLKTGVTVFVKFTVNNTATNNTLTLNVNSTGAKKIYWRGAQTFSAGYIGGNRVIGFVYDGTNWEIIGELDTSTSVIQTVTTTNATYPILMSDLANATANRTSGVRFGSGVKINPKTNTIYATTFNGDVDFPITEAEIDAIFNGNS